MIITCTNCNKKFKIDNSLIPNEGRDLQCGSCNHIWFYKIEEENNDVLKLNDEIFNKNVETKVEKIEEIKRPQKKIKDEINIKQKAKISEKQKNSTSNTNVENKGTKFFSFLVVFIISFVALIILLDTLKTPLINVFPGIEIILFNLFETLQDLKLFIIDLL
tara:strand:- start:12 stop:497 length:486 start_codon:yes stop_codon:yes gene_type:complete